MMVTSVCLELYLVESDICSLSGCSWGNFVVEALTLFGRIILFASTCSILSLRSIGSRIARIWQILLPMLLWNRV